MKTKATRQFRPNGMEIIVIVATLCVLAPIAIPGFARVRAATQKTGCIDNLKKIDAAKAVWAKLNKKTGGDAATLAALVHTTYLYPEPKCKAGGKYSPGTVGSKTTCSIPGHAY
jgi:hypothetical protein